MAKAHVKGIKNDGDGGSPMSTIIITTDDKPVRDITFNLPYLAAALNLNVGDLVRYSSANLPGTKTEVVLYCERLTSGVIASLGGDNMSGVITETDSGKAIPFLQPYEDLNLLAVGTAVKYTLVSASAYGPTASAAASSSSASVGTSSAAGTASDDLAILVKVDPTP